MTQIDNEKFGDLIRRLRKEKHMTQKEQKLFVSSSASGNRYDASGGRLPAHE